MGGVPRRERVICGGLPMGVLGQQSRIAGTKDLSSDRVDMPLQRGDRLMTNGLPLPDAFSLPICHLSGLVTVLGQRSQRSFDLSTGGF